MRDYVDIDYKYYPTDKPKHLQVWGDADGERLEADQIFTRVGYNAGDDFTDLFHDDAFYDILEQAEREYYDEKHDAMIDKAIDKENGI
jgi:hypothetical protein